MSAFNTADAISSVGDAGDSASSRSGGGGSSAVSGGRQTQSLGAIADFNDTVSVQRALAQTNSQIRQVASSFGDAGLGFKEIQGRTLQTQKSALEGALKAINEKQQAEIVDAIINANQDLTGEQLTQKINEQLAVRARYNLLPATGGSVAGFRSLQGARV